ncbi:hypothetical protein F5Y07DRAFT_154270 [Xylaria sp. FL0933]|nr:hypothetical protein F5Y07DRAFT_154270 [Xylaria sp. FL0933]
MKRDSPVNIILTLSSFTLPVLPFPPFLPYLPTFHMHAHIYKSVGAEPAVPPSHAITITTTLLHDPISYFMPVAPIPSIQYNQLTRKGHQS